MQIYSVAIGIGGKRQDAVFICHPFGSTRQSKPQRYRATDMHIYCRNSSIQFFIEYLISERPLPSFGLLCGRILFDIEVIENDAVPGTSRRATPRFLRIFVQTTEDYPILFILVHPLRYRKIICALF